MEKSKIIKILISVGACWNELVTFYRWRKTIEKYAIEYPENVLWAYGKCPELQPTINQMKIEGIPAIEWYIKNFPSDTLKYISKYIHPNILEKCARQAPISAIRFAKNLLPIQTLKWCARKAPAIALIFAADKLPLPLLKYCARKAPNAAPYAAHLLN